MTSNQSDETKISLIGKDISYIKDDISEIKTSIKGLDTIFASKEQLRVVAKETEEGLCKLENASALWRWAAPILGAVMGSFVTFLLLEYLKDLK